MSRFEDESKSLPEEDLELGASTKVGLGTHAEGFTSQVRPHGGSMAVPQVQESGSECQGEEVF